MAIITVSACQCDVCGHVWLKESDALPVCCPSRKCRSRLWNALAATSPRYVIEANQERPRERVTISGEYARSLEKQLKREPILDKSGDYTQELI